MPISKYFNTLDMEYLRRVSYKTLRIKWNGGVKYVVDNLIQVQKFLNESVDIDVIHYDLSYIINE